MLNIAVFVSGGGTNLQALIDAQKSGLLKSGKITLVLSSKKGVFALERAEKNGIETAVISRKDLKSSEDFDRRILQTVKSHNIDIIVLAGFLSILGDGFIKEYKDRIINVHPSLIPSFCGKGMYGLKVHEAALGRGVKLTGATVHFVNEIPDGGRIIAQKGVEVLPDDTPETLQKRVMEQAEWILLPKAVESVCSALLSDKK